MKKCLAALALISILALPGLAQTGPASKSREPIATLDGQPIYKADLPAEVRAKLMRLRNQIYDIESKGLESVIQKKIIEEEAGKQGISSEQLLKKEVDSKIPEPSQAEVEGYYLAIRDRVKKPFAELQPQLQQAVKRIKIRQGRQEYTASLRAKAQVAMLLAAQRVKVSYDPARVRGNPNAPVTIVEFADFQCPYCKAAESTVENLLKKYKGRVKLAYRDYPLSSIHPHAEAAAEAARCAQAQGKFWAYHDALFANQSKLDVPGLEATAKKLGLDQKAFDSCLKSAKFKAAINQDVKAGLDAGVQGTPAFFINGEFLSGAKPEAEFARVIDRELAATGRKPSASVTVRSAVISGTAGSRQSAQR